MRRKKSYSNNPIIKNNLNLKEIFPKGKKQELAFQYYEAGQHLFLTGVPGSGKSILAMYFALKSLYDPKQNFNKLLIIRSSVPSREIGHLPGTAKEKMAAYEAPYYGIFSELFGRDDAYTLLKQKNIVEFIPTSFLRGTTFNNCIIVVEEAENMIFQEISTIITRIGKNTRIILNGDFRQTDLKYEDEKFGFKKFIDIVKKMKSFSFVEFGIEDILRSHVVKEFIIETLNYEDSRRC